MRTMNNRGFTLLEVLIVVAIFAIGAAIALPSLMDMGRRGQVKTEVRQLKDQLARARATAIEENTPILVVFDTVNSSYQLGQDADADWALSAAEQDRQISLTSTISLTPVAPDFGFTNTLLQWDTRGYPRDKNGALDDGTIMLTGSGTSFKINVSLAGNIQISKP